jgi:hypothetical protein
MKEQERGSQNEIGRQYRRIPLKKKATTSATAFPLRVKNNVQIPQTVLPLRGSKTVAKPPDRSMH